MTVHIAAVGRVRRFRSGQMTARPPIRIPIAIVSPCQASVTGPSSIVGSIPIVIVAACTDTL